MNHWMASAGAWRWVVAWLAVLSLESAASGGSLESSFLKPPRSARPWVYWFFMDGNLDRAGMTADLEAMDRAGLGGAIMMEVDVGIPRGTTRFMSPEWQACFGHAVREAERMGLELTLNAGPGWTGSGGPWVTPEQSMQHLVASDVVVEGPRRFAGPLPKPSPRKPFFGEGGLPPALEQARKEFYEDVVVLAFPTPKGSFRLSDIDEKALYYRAPYSSQPGVRPHFPVPDHYKDTPAEACIASSTVIDLTDRMSVDGRLDWEVPSGSWTVLRFGRTSTGQNTRPAPAPGLGLESDKFDQAALDAHFEAYVGSLLRTVGSGRKSDRGWTMLHIDSWEMSSQNWTGRFREEFQRRRGYDLWRYLPVMTGRLVDSEEVSERFLWDLRQTAQELVIDHHARHLKERAGRHGMGLSIEPYDMNPCADLSLGAVADVPMCEFWATGHGFRSEYSCIEAVSIAHTMGRPIVAAEAFTSGDSERWQLYPGAMKRQGDWAFCAGINRIVFHRYQHQPWLDRAPGMTMGPYGVHWERTQTWWELSRSYHDYLARCQLLLRRGLPVADILYLVPEGAPHVFRPPASATRGDLPDRRGYNFDACAPEVLMERARVRDGRIWFQGGMSYAVLVLPRVAAMTPPLLEKVRELVEAGATVMGEPPRRSPSLSRYPGCDQEVRALARAIWQDGTDGRRAIALGSPGGAELYPAYETTASHLATLGVAPDFESDKDLRYVHRREGGAHFYFVSNPVDVAVNAIAAFRVTGKQPDWWDPVDGTTRVLPEFTQLPDRTMVPLRLEPGQSGFVVFRRAASRSGNGVNAREFEPLMELRGPWELRFQANRGAPERLTTERLFDWSKSDDPGVRHFSGVATYRTTFEWRPEPRRALARRAVWLDVGRVEVMAEVIVNGSKLGVVWTPPFRLDATRALRSGMNVVEIRVANLWPNRLIGDVSLPEKERIAWTTWNPFTKESTLLPSGLLGPVTLGRVLFKPELGR